MRVNPNSMPDLLTALSATQQQQDTELLQLSTGRRVNQPSDDPAAEAQLIENNADSAQVDSFQQSLSSINGQFQTADSTLSSIETQMQRAITLGTQAANQGTLSDSDRLAIANELQGIQNQLVSLANTSYQGVFLFSGTVQTQPFVVDASVPSGVRYAGNTGVNKVTVGAGYQIQVNQPGSQLFSASGSDIFQSMTDLIQSIQTNSNIGNSVAEVNKAFTYLSTQRVFFGNAMNQVTSQQNFLSSETVELSTQENTIAGADISVVASNLVQTENAQQAALQAIGRMPVTSLFDFLQE
ncbi:MAG TPA: flagellar hook-associated protein FlgL [Terriglobales bacterium]|jgi:flagellar hook-associated protein 3 FlgL